ncbi:unnamed protein product [Sphagnum balticum]
MLLLLYEEAGLLRIPYLEIIIGGNGETAAVGGSNCYARDVISTKQEGCHRHWRRRRSRCKKKQQQHCFWYVPSSFPFLSGNACLRLNSLRRTYRSRNVFRTEFTKSFQRWRVSSTEESSGKRQYKME